jgi:glutamyl-tRNA synthetase
MSNPEIRVRYAPSPTGIPHVGNIRTALFDYFFARHNDGKFILRIEDTDQSRRVEGAEEAIQQSLTWLGADWDEYAVQSERLPEYKKVAVELLQKGFAKEDSGAIRFIVPKTPSRTISWKDAIGNKTISFESRDIEDFIILKKDGYPTYHLANVVDDHLMGISHVLRGDDWVSSTPKHLLLYEALSWDPPVFAHVPNVLGPDHQKLSKRKGAKSVLDFKKEGYLPEALLNALMLLGWNPGGDQEIFTKNEIIKKFSLERVNVAPAVFDQNGKLAWLNVEYMMRLGNEKLLERIYDFDPTLKEFDSELVSKLVEPAKTRMKTLADFRRLVEPFLGRRKDHKPQELKGELRKALTAVQDWTKDNILEAIKKLIADNKVRLPDIYEAIIGQRQGLSLSDVFEVMGRDRTLAFLS